MNLLEFLSALGGAMGELEGLSMVARDYATRLWNVSRITLGEDQFYASILEGGDGIMGIAREDFVGVFKPPIGKALFDHVLWARQALVREAVGKCSLIVGRVARDALAWVMAGFCLGNSDFLVARVWRDGKKPGAVKTDGKLHGYHPWLLAQAQPPVPYLESFSVYGVGAFSGTLADFTFSEGPDWAWEFAAISFLAAAMFPYVGSLGVPCGALRVRPPGRPGGDCPHGSRDGAGAAVADPRKALAGGRGFPACGPDVPFVELRFVPEALIGAVERVPKARGTEEGSIARKNARRLPLSCRRDGLLARSLAWACLLGGGGARGRM
jgi:hypothetical protein